jgi:lipopolysaccharide heptosyltransferase II
VRTDPSSFLIINPFGIGDVLFSTPLVRNLKETFPGCRISYLCNRRTESVLKANPFIAKTIVYERDEFEALRQSSKIAWAKKFFELIGQIKKQKAQVVFDLSLNSQFGFFSWFAGIKKRLGLDYKKRGRFLTQKVVIRGYNDKHVADYYLDVLQLLDIAVRRYRLEVYTDSQSKAFADEFVERNSLKDKLIIGIAPCGGQAFGPQAHVKRWPQEKFAALIEMLVQEYKAKIFIFAGPNEREEVADILNKSGCADDCYEFTDLSLDKIIALVDRCSLFIGNDTGPLRFANGLDKNIVALFGPVDDKVYGLYPHDPKKHKVVSHELDCRPCYKRFRLPECHYNRRCLKDITVEEVFKAVKALI